MNEELNTRSITELKLKIVSLESELLHWNNELHNLEHDLCHFQYKSHDEAKNDLEYMLECEASNDCEGTGNCGADVYAQEYQLIGSDVIYVGILNVEYNRHDKQYYYVDSYLYSFEVKPRIN